MRTNSTSIFNLGVIGGLVLLFALSQVWMNYGNLAAGAAPWEMWVNIGLLSVPLGLLYGSLGLLIFAARQRRLQGRIDRRLAGWLYWLPRVGGILITLFVGLFALDAFSGPGSFWQLVGGVLMHLLPAFLVGAVVILAWRREWLGFRVFLAAAAFFFFFSVLSGSWYALGNILLFVAPLTLIALLYRANWEWRAELHSLAPL